MLRALGKKKSSGTDAGGVATSKSDAGNSASSNRNRRRSRSPFRMRGRSRSKSRDRKSSKRKNASSKAAAIMEANAKIGVASPEPTLGGAVHGSAASTACSSVGSSSMSPYAQDSDEGGDDAFFRMQTEKYNKMMVGGASVVAAAAKSTIPAPSIRSNVVSVSAYPISSSSSSSSSRGAPQDSNRATPMPTYLSNSRSSSRLKTSSFGTIVEEKEEDIDAEDGVVNDENADSAPAPSPERFLHRATADEKIRPPSARVTFAGDGPTSPFQPPSRNRIFLLLLEPNKKVFELIQVEYDAKTATIGYILGLIKLHASEQALVRQKHVGLIRPRDDVELTDRTMLATSQGRIKHGEVLIPLPEDCRSSKCRRLAKTILKTPSVVKLLSKEQPLSSRPRRRSKSRSRRSVSPGRRGTTSSTNAHTDEAMRRAALEEASRAATKALEEKIAQLEKRLADVASSSSSQSGGSGSNKELSDKIRKEIEEKAEAREELEEQMKKEAEMSASERIEQMAKEAEKSAASEKPSHRSQGVQPMSFSFEHEKVEESSGIAAAMESVSDILADGIKIVKPKLRRVRNTIRSVKKRARRSKNKPLIAASVGVLLFSFLYGFFGGSTTTSDNLFFTEESSSMIISSSLPYAIVGLMLGGSALIFFANNLTKATGRSRRSSALRSSSRKKGRLLRGASNIRSANAASRRRGQMGR